MNGIAVRRGPHDSMRSLETDDMAASYAVSAWYSVGGELPPQTARHDYRQRDTAPVRPVSQVRPNTRCRARRIRAGCRARDVPVTLRLPTRWPRCLRENQAGFVRIGHHWVSSMGVGLEFSRRRPGPSLVLTPRPLPGQPETLRRRRSPNRSGNETQHRQKRCRSRLTCPSTDGRAGQFRPTAYDRSRIGGGRRWHQVKSAVTQRDCGHFLLPSSEQFLRTRRRDWGWQ
jgi:hypothetical protein